MWAKIKAVLSALTDILLIGRNRGWWDRGQITDWKEYQAARRMEENFVEQHINGHKVDMDAVDKLASMLNDYEDKLADHAKNKKDTN